MPEHICRVNEHKIAWGFVPALCKALRDRMQAGCFPDCPRMAIYACNIDGGPL